MSKDKAGLLQGTLDMLILKALSLGALHGYGVIQRILQLSEEMLDVEQGSLYPALYRIEQRGWVSSKWDVNETGRRAKFYTLTKTGRKQLEVEEASWDRLVLAVARHEILRLGIHDIADLQRAIAHEQLIDGQRALQHVVSIDDRQRRQMRRQATAAA